jgi:hypothetical protein
MQKEPEMTMDPQEVHGQLAEIPWPPEGFRHGDDAPSPEAAALADALWKDIEAATPRVEASLEALFYKGD